MGRLFNQPLAKRSERVFDRSLYYGDANGTPILTSKVRVVVGADYLWLVPPIGEGRPTSIPLAWVVSAQAVGHGVRVGWHNRAANRQESLMFGVRGILFYQPKERDRLAALLLTGAKSAKAPSAEAPLTCEECGQSPVDYYALQRFSAFADLAVSQQESYAYCRVHGRKAIRATIFRNAMIGTLGLFGLRALRHASELTEFAVAKELMSPEEAGRLRLASILIPACVVAIFAAAIFFANLEVK